MEVDEVPDEEDTMPFPREDVVMMIYDGHPPLGMCHVSKKPKNSSMLWLGVRDAGL
jgi:hypothetical protein